MKVGSWLISLLLLWAVQARATINIVQLADYPVVLAIADINHDGHLDIVTAADDIDGDEEWHLVALRGYGNGTYYSAQTNDLNLADDEYTISAIKIGVLGGDSHPDVAYLVQGPPFDKLYRNQGNGDGTFG